MGYVGVETYALPASLTLPGAAKVFKECGLKVFGMHTELPIGDQRQSVLKMADTYECDHVIYAGWPQGDKHKDLDAIKRTAQLYDETAVYLKSKGLRFGLHNHWWEFEKTDGVYPFYYLLEHLSPEIFFEIDTYWAKTGGMNPAKVVADFGKRAPFLHIKDGPAIKGDKAYEQVPAGKGTMDFPSIVEAAGQNTKWMIVEFDEYAGDIFEGMNTSATFLTSKGLTKGKE
jgi:sugar phosphate isomerase/epimerase